MTVMLYRPAEQPNPAVWDAYVEHAVFDEGAVDQALAEGWVRHPNDVRAIPHSGAGGGGGSYEERLLSEQAPGEVVTFKPKRRGRPPKEG